MSAKVPTCVVCNEPSDTTYCPTCRPRLAFLAARSLLAFLAARSLLQVSGELPVVDAAKQWRSDHEAAAAVYIEKVELKEGMPLFAM